MEQEEPAWKRLIKDTKARESLATYEGELRYYTNVDPKAQEILDSLRLIGIDDDLTRHIGAERLRNVVLGILNTSGETSAAAGLAVYYLPTVHLLFRDDPDIIQLAKEYLSGD